MKHTLLIVLLMAFCVTVCPLTGCVTTRTPDGVTTTQMDLATTIALTQLALNSAEQAWQFWEANHRDTPADVVAAEKSKREADMIPMRDSIEALTRELAALKK